MTLALKPSPSPRQLRSVALAHQGLAGKRRIGTGLAGAEKALCQLGYVQIDTISVVARAHHHTFYNRVGRYDALLPNRLVGTHRAFEYWSHAACYLPMRDYRFALPMMRSVANGEWGYWHRGMDSGLRARVLDRIRAEGPLFARDFEDTRRGRSGWWDRKPAKRALEQLFMEGELVSIERRGFQKRYELAERFLPSTVDVREPSAEAHAGHLIDLTLQAHGFAAAGSITYLRRDPKLRAMVRNRLEECVRRGALLAHRTAAGEPIYARPGTFDAAPKRIPPVVRILSPFDNLVIQRRRAAHIFDFEYTLECYVPAAKRRLRLLRAAFALSGPLSRAHGLQGASLRTALRDQGAVPRMRAVGCHARRLSPSRCRLREVHGLRGDRSGQRLAEILDAVCKGVACGLGACAVQSPVRGDRRCPRGIAPSDMTLECRTVVSFCSFLVLQGKIRIDVLPIVVEFVRCPISRIVLLVDRRDI